MINERGGVDSDTQDALPDDGKGTSSTDGLEPDLSRTSNAGARMKVRAVSLVTRVRPKYTEQVQFLSALTLSRPRLNQPVHLGGESVVLSGAAGSKPCKSVASSSCIEGFAR